VQHYDLGVVIGILAIVLTIPLSLVANLMTPSIKNWWAARSTASLRKRIDKLENQLAEYEQYTEMSEEGELIMIAGCVPHSFLTLE